MRNFSKKRHSVLRSPDPQRIYIINRLSKALVRDDKVVCFGCLLYDFRIDPYHDGSQLDA